MAHYSECISKILFRSQNPAPLRAIVIGNCQARYLAPLFELAVANCTCDYLCIDEIVSDDQQRAIDAHLNDARMDYRLILAQPLGAEWQAIGRDALIARFGRDRLFFLLNLHLHGAFPDVTMLGDATRPIFGPMGACHSRIALGGWMANRTIEDILGMFSPASFERLGYLALMDESAKILRADERDCDTKFTEALLNIAKISFAFYSFNRPTPNLLINYVAHVTNILKSTRQVELNELPFNAMLAAETLASEGIWPIYPELRASFAPQFPVSTSFILPDRGAGSEVISRETFVRRSLACYDDIGRERIRELHQAQNSRELIQRHAVR